MFRKIISIVFIIFLLPASVSAHTATIEISGGSTYKAVRLTPEIYNYANSDLSDILIKDEKGDNVPYFINSGRRTYYETDAQVYPMTLINAYTKDESFYFDYMLSDTPDRDIEGTSIDITTNNTGFAKDIELYGSYDNLNWEFVQNDTIYSIDGKSKLNIELTNTRKYTHYRFKLGNNLERISFDTVTLMYNHFTQEESNFTESLFPDFSTEEKDSRTYISIDGLKNLRLKGISVNADGVFVRTVSSPFGISKEIYNLSFNDASYLDTTIALNGLFSADDTFVLTIDNGDDRPLRVKGITVDYFVDELVFAGGDDGIYTLDFGADDTKTAPVYDIEKYKYEILAGDIYKLVISDVKIDAGSEAEATPFDYRIIFNVVVVLVAVFLGLLLLIKLRKKPERGEEP